MGGSPVAAVQDASDDADARVVVLVAGSPVDSASDSLPPPVAATPAAEAKQEPVPVLGPEEPKQEAEAAAAAAGVQAMAVTVVRDVETGLDASTSDRDGDGAGDKPSWFTPKR